MASCYFLLNKLYFCTYVASYTGMAEHLDLVASLFLGFGLCLLKSSLVYSIHFYQSAIQEKEQPFVYVQSQLSVNDVMPNCNISVYIVTSKVSCSKM